MAGLRLAAGTALAELCYKWGRGREVGVSPGDPTASQKPSLQHRGVPQSGVRLCGAVLAGKDSFRRLSVPGCARWEWAVLSGVPSCLIPARWVRCDCGSRSPAAIPPWGCGTGPACSAFFFPFFFQAIVEGQDSECCLNFSSWTDVGCELPRSVTANQSADAWIRACYCPDVPPLLHSTGTLLRVF